MNTRSWKPLLSPLTVWLFVMIGSSLFRLVLIAAFVRVGPLFELAHALVVGARFDAVVATLVATPSLVCAVPKTFGALWFPDPGRAAEYSLLLFLSVAAPFLAADFLFFAELSTHLDQRVLAIGVDAGAILRTVWAAHHPVAALLASVAVVVIGRRAFARISRSLDRAVADRPMRAFAWVLLVVCYVGCVRGFSWGVSPIRIRNAYVTSNAELNHAIPSAFAFLWHSLEDRSSERAPVAERARDEALAWLSARRGVKAPPVAEALARQVRGAQAPPKHVFLVLLEGQHGFPLLPKFRDAGLAPRLAAMADAGAYFPSFVSAGGATDGALAVALAGLFLPGMNLLHEERAARPFVTALAPQLAQMGFRTRFFYGGYLGWSRLDLFVAGQGFDEVYGAPHIGSDVPGNVWGVWDRHLFDFVARSIDPEQPSFNVVLTTNNHSPYDLDETLAPALSDSALLRGADAATLVALRHERYVDAALGDFVEELNARLPLALFAITGDHPSRPLRLPLDASEQMRVPLVLFGSALPSAARGKHEVAGSTLDIAATLLQLCATSGSYTTLGVDLLSKPLDAPAFGVRGVLRRGSLCAIDAGDCRPADAREWQMWRTISAMLLGDQR